MKDGWVSVLDFQRLQCGAEPGAHEIHPALVLPCPWHWALPLFVLHLQAGAGTDPAWEVQLDVEFLVLLSSLIPFFTGISFSVLMFSLVPLLLLPWGHNELQGLAFWERQPKGLVGGEETSTGSAAPLQGQQPGKGWSCQGSWDGKRWNIRERLDIRKGWIRKVWDIRKGWISGKDGSGKGWISGKIGISEKTGSGTCSNQFSNEVHLKLCFFSYRCLFSEAG